jgi:lysophospholipid acyltransferase (LPLAT)-like uncharacterized protein
MAFLKRVAQSRIVQKTVGVLAAEYLRLVWKTSTVVVEPADIYEEVVPQLPVIIAMWHGQHFLVPFVRRAHRAKVLISRHRDGEMNAIAAEWLGVGTIRGSGDMGGRFDRKGGVGAFKAMLDAIEEGYSMALTADVPKVSRVAGAGIIKLAQLSGRTVVPVAIATSRRIELKSWDRSAINLPLSRMAIVAGDLIRVAADADEAALDSSRLALQSTLNAATARAFAIADGRDGGRARG